MDDVLKDTRTCTFILLEELLLIIVSNVIWCLGPSPMVDHVLLDELTKLLLVELVQRMSVVTELAVVDLDETIRSLNIADFVRSCLKIRFCVRNHAHVRLVGPIICIR